MILETNIKGYSPDIRTPVEKLNIFIGKNESGKSSLALGATLPMTGIALDELFRGKLTGRNLKSLRHEDDETVFAQLSLGDVLLARWEQEGKGNPSVSGKVGGKYADVWSELRDALAGYSPKLLLCILNSPRGQELITPEITGVMARYEETQKEIAKHKKADPGPIPSMPPDPSEEALAAFEELERAAGKGVDVRAYRKRVASACSELGRWKRGKQRVEARAAFDRRAAELKAILSGHKDHLIRVSQPVADEVCAAASTHLRKGESISLDLTANTLVFTRNAVPHLAPSRTLEAWIIMALGSVLWGGKGVLTVPDLQWDFKNCVAWLDATARSDLGMVSLTLASLKHNVKLHDAWNVVRLEG